LEESEDEKELLVMSHLSAENEELPLANERDENLPLVSERDENLALANVEKDEELLQPDADEEIEAKPKLVS